MPGQRGHRVAVDGRRVQQPALALVAVTHLLQLAQTETGGSNLREAMSEKAMGRPIEELKKSLPDLLKDHTAWVATAGRSGKRLDLSGVDMREIPELNKYPLTAIKAVGTNFLNQNLSGVEMLVDLVREPG